MSLISNFELFCEMGQKRSLLTSLLWGPDLVDLYGVSKKFHLEVSLAWFFIHVTNCIDVRRIMSPDVDEALLIIPS